jgi:hypothetical protein
VKRQPGGTPLRGVIVDCVSPGGSGARGEGAALLSCAAAKHGENAQLEIRGGLPQKNQETSSEALAAVEMGMDEAVSKSIAPGFQVMQESVAHGLVSSLLRSSAMLFVRLAPDLLMQGCGRQVNGSEEICSDVLRAR